MTSLTAADTVQQVMLESAYVSRVNAIVLSADERTISARFGVANLVDVAALPPLFAQLRADLKAALPSVEQVFLEPDFTEQRSGAVPTESIVIRGWD